jgi:pimeloyl-ACP methyl ester carboxylesterase
MVATPSAPWSGVGVDQYVEVGDDLVMHCVRAGAGQPTLVLLHGWPQSAYAWRNVLPSLASRFTVLAVDLRGVGGSSVPGSGYDKRTLAQDIKALVDRLELTGVVIVGHDVGAMAAYEYARAFTAETNGIVVLDTPLPGVPGWDLATSAFPAWHIGFHRDVNHEQGIADTVIDGHQAFYFRSFIDRFAAHPGRIDDAAVQVYASAYAAPSRLRAGFEMFRALPLDVQSNLAHSGDLPVPILLAFGEYSYASVLGTVADGLRSASAHDVRTAVISDCGHWPAEEKPEELVGVITDFVQSLGG